MLDEPRILKLETRIGELERWKYEIRITVSVFIILGLLAVAGGIAIFWALPRVQQERADAESMGRRYSSSGD